MKQGCINIDFQTPQVMAILNVTPDSFYKQSRTFSADEIEDRVKKIISEGATIIDVGGYSSRPMADDISIEEEWNRVDRGVGIIRRLAPQMAISIDTFRSEVAAHVIEKYGPVIINDISAGEIDPKLIDIAAKYRVPYIAMHMRGTPQTMQQLTNYDNIIEDVTLYFESKIGQLKSRGVDNIIIDPGFGFAKTIEQNYMLMSNLNRLSNLGYPILAGVSRKSMIYKVLEISAEESLTGTIALNWEALRQGAMILRVHDVREAVETLKIFNKLIAV
ncbi:MAG: dihydropteroate synthase [Rikenellaceae bacterium]